MKYVLIMMYLKIASRFLLTFFVLLGIGCGSARMSIPGTLIITGGGTVDARSRDEINRLLLIGDSNPIGLTREDIAGLDSKLVVIPTASSEADDPNSRQETRERYQRRGFAQVSVMHTREAAEAEAPHFSLPLMIAGSIWMPGGAQDRLAEPYRDTLTHQRMRDLLARGGVIGGTSAGAAVMSEVMIAGGNPDPVLETGLGFLPGYIIDQHFTQRGRMPRLVNALKQHPELIGMGIDESTSVIIHGSSLRVIGPGNVYLVRFSPSTRRVTLDILSAGDERRLGERP